MNLNTWTYKMEKTLLLLCIILSVNLTALAQKVVIVTATEYCATLTQDDVKKLYKGEISRAGSNPVLFLDHQANTKIYQDFIMQYFNASSADMQKHWQQVKVESGKSPPKFLPEAFLTKALRSMKGSVSYYYEGQVPEGLTTIPK